MRLTTTPFKIAELILFGWATCFALIFYSQIDDKLPQPAHDAKLQTRLKELSDDWMLPEEKSASDASRADGGLKKATLGHLKHAVLLSPWWADRPRTWNLALPIFPTSHTTAPEDLWGLEKIILVSLDELPNSDVKASLALLDRAGFQQSGLEERFGQFTLRQFVSSRPTTPVFRATSNLDQIQLSLSEMDEEANFHTCQKTSPTTHTCRLKRGAAPLSFRLLPKLREINFKPYRCLALTSPKGASLRIEFPNADMGKVFHVVAGPTGQANLRKEPKRHPLSVEVKLDGHQVVEWEWLPGDGAEKHQTLENFGTALGNFQGRHRLSLTVRGDPNYPTEFCFEGESWR